MTVQRERSDVRSTIGWIASALAVGAAAWAAWDYRRWMALGPGGLPANVRGWVAMNRFRMIARNGLDVRPIAAVLAAGDWQAWSNIQRRAGNRPSVSPYPIPHRQLDQLPDEITRRELACLFDNAVIKHQEHVEYALSYFEKRHPAITLRSSVGSWGARSHGEIAHIHPSDNSMHMILSPPDAVAAIEMGWAQRHGLAGIAVGLPVTYVLVYAPRNQRDLAVVAELLEAAISYAMQQTFPLL